MNISEIGTRCTGCFACASKCALNLIKMEKNEYGFYHAIITESSRCVDCGRCLQVCPIKQHPKESVPIAAFYGSSHDRDILQYSSSGGLFPSIAQNIISKNGIVYGAVMDYKKKSVMHLSSPNATLQEMSGSKYIQSYICNSFQNARRDLEQGKTVLFSGAKCQIYGLKQSIPDSLQENLYTMDFVCHGVASPLLFDKYIKFFERIHHTKITNYNWRSKKRGWNRATTLVSCENGKKYYIAGGFSFMYSLFSDNVSVSPACIKCPFSSCSFSDITIADYWDYKGRVEDADLILQGISLGMINSEKGDRLCRNTESFDLIGNLEVPNDTDYCFVNREQRDDSAQKRFYRQFNKYGLFAAGMYYCRHVIKGMFNR